MDQDEMMMPVYVEQDGAMGGSGDGMVQEWVSEVNDYEL